MTTTDTVLTTLVVLGAAGLAPTWALVGRQWTLVPLSILTGTVVSAAAATCFLAFGGSLMGWFVAIATAAVGAVGLHRMMERRARPLVVAPDKTRVRDGHPRSRLVGRSLVACALVLTSLVCLRGLRTPMVGLDSRLFWFSRAGWWLWPHALALANMRNIGAQTHAGYPPLISSTVAVAWWISGGHSQRVAEVLIALVNATAAMTAAWALFELGSALSDGSGTRPHPFPVEGTRSDGPPKSAGVLSTAPLWAGAVVSVLALFVFYGVTEPFTTNGYADPLWAVAATGAVVYLFQLPARRANAGAAVILLAVAGEAKTEGTATVAAIVVLVVVRSVWRHAAVDRRSAGITRRLGAAAGAMVALALWPTVMRLRHVGADLNTAGPRQATVWSRAQAAYHGLVPHLHVVLVAVLLSIAASFVVARLRRPFATGTVLWAWVALIAGLATIGAAYVLGPGNLFFLDLWLRTSAHRVTEFPALMAWWIVAAIVVVAVAAPAALLSENPDTPVSPLLAPVEAVSLP